MNQAVFGAPINPSSYTEKVIWTDKKRPFFGKPWSFTRYTLHCDRLMVETGLLTFRQDELRLYRILDVRMTQSVLQRIFGIGSILISSADSTTPVLKITHVKDPKIVLRTISDAAESERNRYRIGMVEGLGIW